MGTLLFDFLIVCALSSLLAVHVHCTFGPSTPVFIKVDKSGKGDFSRIQDAIDAVPSNNSDFIFISIEPGIYEEKITIPVDKPFITLSGADKYSTIITWSERHHTYNVATLAVFASDFEARSLTIQNTFPFDGKPSSGNQAVALLVRGERVAFYRCRFLSYQDTILDDQGTHYYKSCYIEGGTDFICGNGLAVFEKCHMHSISKYGGAITAQRRSSISENTGFTFIRGKVTGEKGGKAILGRSWGNYSRVVFALTYMSDVVLPQGWDDWGSPANQRTTYYAQYMCQGPGANTEGRVNWSHELSYREASQFLNSLTVNGQDWLRPEWLRPPRIQFIKYSNWKIVTGGG